MKKIVAIICILAAAITLAACGNVRSSESTGSQSSSGENMEPVKQNRAVDGEELLFALRSSPFKDDIENDEYGIKAAYAVGVDEKAFSKVLYPVPSDGEFDIICEVNGENGTLNGVNAVFASLKGREGKKLVRFEKGEYRFNGPVNLSGIDDLYIDGKGSGIVFTTWCRGFEVNNCKNLHFNDFSVDYDPSPAVSGKVVSCDTSANTVTVKIYDEFDLSLSIYNGGKIGYGSYMEFTKDEHGALYPNPNGNLLYNSTGDKVTSITGGSYNKTNRLLTLSFTSIKEVAADTEVSVAFTMYEYETFRVGNCENVYFEGCDVYSSAGMTFSFKTVTNCYLNRTNIRLKEGSKRLMTATADGFHSNDVCGDLHITASIYENTHDDAVNICSFYKRITANSGRTLQCESPDSVHNFPIREGDVLEIYDPASFELKGTYTAVSVNASFTTYTVTLNKFVQGDISGMIAGNVTRNPAVKINDCIFRNKRNRGILLQSRNCDVSGNAFVNVIHGALSLHSVLDIFSEAIVPANITVTNNKIINDNFGGGLAGSVSVFAYGNKGRSVAGSIKNITVSNNFFFRTAQSAVSFSAAGECRAENNLFCGVGVKHSSDSRNCGVRADISEKITVSGNCALAEGAGEGFAVVKFTDSCSECIETNNFIK